MHELSVAQDMMEIINQHLPARPDVKVKRVKLIIGEMAGVVPESLEFCFQVLTPGTPLEGAVLTIDRIPVELECRSCSGKFTTEAPVFLCPSCGGRNVEMLRGNELRVSEIEIDGPEE